MQTNTSLIRCQRCVDDSSSVCMNSAESWDRKNGWISEELKVMNLGERRDMFVCGWASVDLASSFSAEKRLRLRV